MPINEHPVKLFMMYLDDESCYEVYAMDVKDAYNTLLKNEPHLTVKDIQFIEEHACPTAQEKIH
jgi:hypothetical protein